MQKEFKNKEVTQNKQMDEKLLEKCKIELLREEQQ